MWGSHPNKLGIQATFISLITTTSHYAYAHFLIKKVYLRGGHITHYVPCSTCIKTGSLCHIEVMATLVVQLCEILAEITGNNYFSIMTALICILNCHRHI